MSQFMAASDDKLRRLELLLRVGVALSAETDTNRLLETILLEAKELTRADGGTLYLRQDEDSIHFAIMRTDSLGIAIGYGLVPITAAGKTRDDRVAVDWRGRWWPDLLPG